MWLDRPTHEGLWWLRSSPDAKPEPVRVHAMWLDREDGSRHFGVSYLGSEDTTNEHDTPGQWMEMALPTASVG